MINLTDRHVEVIFEVESASEGSNPEEGNVGIPEVDIQMSSIAITAKTRKLKAVWTPELAQDLNAYHSVDAEAELTSMLSEYISMEIDLEILDMLISDAQQLLIGQLLQVRIITVVVLMKVLGISQHSMEHDLSGFKL